MKLGINVAPPDYFSPPWAFADVMLASGTGSGQWNAGGAPAPLDADGCPVLLAGKTAFTRAYWKLAGHYPGGAYVASWDGDGTVTFGGDATAPHSPGPQSSPVQVTPSSNGVIVTIARSNPADPVRNIRLIPSGTSARFRPEYLAGFAAFPGPIRFKDWQYTQSWPEYGWLRWADRATPGWSSQAIPPYPLADGRGSPVVDGTVTPNKPYLRGAGVSLEYCIDLCNTLGRDGWFCIPHVATDEYVYGMATLIRDRLAPGLKAYFEYSNEVWNGSYVVSAYCQHLGIAAGDANQPILTGKSTEIARLFGIVDQVFAGSPQALKVVADQLGWPQRIDILMSKLQALGYTAVDVLSGAPYFGPDSAALATYTATTAVAQVLADSAAMIANELTANLALYQQYASKWSAALGRPIALWGYECGPELNPGNKVYAPAFVAAGTDPGIGPVITQLFAAMQAAGFAGGCYYNDLSAPTPYGTYGLRSYQDGPWTDPKPAAVAAWPNS